MPYVAFLSLVPIRSSSSKDKDKNDEAEIKEDALPKAFETVLAIGERITFGKDKKNTVILYCDLASRKHCSLELIKKSDGQPRLIVRDTSTNGVFLNRQKVKGKRVLSNNDTFHVQLLGDEEVESRKAVGLLPPPQVHNSK